MDIKKLSKLSAGMSPSAEVDTASGKTPLMDSFFSKKERISDSLKEMPSRYKDRESWVKRSVKAIVVESDIDASEVDFITDSVFDFIISKYESRLSRVKDSLGKNDAALSKLQAEHTSAMDLLKKYKSLGSPDAISKKIKDSIESEQSARQQAEELRKQQEEAQRQLEEKQKELELQKQENDALIQQQEAAKAEAQKQQQEAEERQREIEKQKQELEAQKREQELKAQEQQKQEINRTQDNAEVKLDKDLLQRYASLVEDWIQTGSAFVAQKLKSTAKAMNNDDITELTNRMLSYETMDADAYDSLTKNLKDNMKDYGISIPSLPLIQDSAITEALAAIPTRVKEVQFNTLVAVIKDYLEAPNDAHGAKLQDYVDGMPDTPLKKLCQEAIVSKWSQEVREKVASELTALCSTQHDPIEVSFPTEYTLLVPKVREKDLPSDNTIIEPILTHLQYTSVTDSVSKLDMAAKVMKRIKDCEMCTKACNPVMPNGYSEGYPDDFIPAPPGWELYDIKPVEDSPVFAVTINGLAHLVVISPDCQKTSAEVLTLVMSGSYDMRYYLYNKYFLPLKDVMEVAVSMGYYDVVTDSTLYKRKLSDKYWITDSVEMKEGNFESILSKLKLLLSDDAYNQMVSSVSDKKFKKFRIAITDNGKLPSGEEFGSIKVKSYKDFDIVNRKVRLFLQ